MNRPHLTARAARQARISRSNPAAIGIAVAAVLVGGSSAMAQLRIVSYNSSGNVSGAGTAIATVLKGIGDESRAGIQRPLDIVSLQEQDLSLASTQQVVTALNGLYGNGTYAASTIVGAGDSTQSVVYNTRTVSLVAQTKYVSTSSTGAARQPLRFEFRPVGYDANADFYVYASHPKADSDSTSAARRGVEAAATRADADALGAGVRAIYTGDFNVYNATETGFNNLTAAGGAGRAYDPINRVGSWHNSSSYADVHTQSPVLNGGQHYGYQVGGGMDDRFDFQLVTAPVLTTHGFSYINGTYHAFGNAGVQFNNDITANNAASLLAPSFPGYSTADVQSLLTAIAQTSDHIPVVADYRLPAKMTAGTTASSLAARVIQGGTLNVSATVSNSAPVTLASGADQLDYTVSITGSPTAAQSGTILATGASQTRTFALDTATPGDRSATLNVTSSSPGVANGTSSSTYSYTVVAHSTPSLAADTQTTSGSVDLGIVAIGRTAHAAVGVYNLADLSGFTAGLNVTDPDVTGAGSIGGELSDHTLITGGAAHVLNITFSPTTFGVATAAMALATADEDLPGATARDTLQVDVSGFGAHAGDADLTNTIDFADLLVLAKHYGQLNDVTWSDGDFDASGTVDFTDLLALAKGYGFDGTTGTGTTVSAAAFAADWSLAQSLVPEPTLMSGFGFAALTLAGRRRRQSRA